MMKKTICMLLAAVLLALTASGCGQLKTDPATDSDAAPQATAADAVPADALSVAIREINKHGTLILETTFDEMNAAGIEIGDIITVTAGDRTFDLPVGTSYTDVDSGSMICRFDQEDKEVGLAVNMGSFADETGIAEKQTTEADPGYAWDVKIPEVTLQLKEKQGYLDEYNARNLTRTDDRADYPDLTDEEFANFRAVTATGLKENTLYRSTSPIDPDLGRNEYVMAAMEQAGIKTVVNLADSEETMKGYETFEGSYYSGCKVVTPEMGYDFTGEEFAAKVKQSVLFLAENDGPYLIHCKEGKDRTGIFCAILECFAGASFDEVERDYMTTFYNFYGVQKEDTAYGIILNDNLVKNLCGLFGVDALEGLDLKEAATQYLLSVGMTAEQLSLLGEKLVDAA